MYLDAWREAGSDEIEAVAPNSIGAVGGFCQDVASPRSQWIVEAGEESFKPAGRSECWEALLVQKKAVKTSNAFIFSDRKLDGVAAIELASYLRDQCQAKFIDLSRLGRWPEISVPAAGALSHGLRAARSMILDGNDVGGDPEILEAWCAAFQEHPGLQHVSLRDTGLTTAAIVRFAQVLRQHSVLFSVDLGLNRISDVGIEALTGALTENTVLLELNVEGADACDESRRALEQVLERNRSRYGGINSCARMLQGLRRARAEAAAALAHSSARTPSVANPLMRHSGSAPLSDSSAMHLSTAVEVGENQYVWLPLVPGIENTLMAEVDSQADRVFFDAGEGISKELSSRCEAGWRYTDADAEHFNNLRKRVADLKSERRQERDRFEEVMRRIEDAQRIFNKRIIPVQDQIQRLKESLAEEVDSTKSVLQERIQLNVFLKPSEVELEGAREDKHHSVMNVQALEHSLKVRHMEVDEEVQKLQSEIVLCEEATEKIGRQNETFRRRLHAARFETEDERFVPRFTAAEKAAAAATPVLPESTWPEAAGASAELRSLPSASPTPLVDLAPPMAILAYPSGPGSALAAIADGDGCRATRTPAAGSASALAAIGVADPESAKVQLQARPQPLPPPGPPPSRSFARPPSRPQPHAAMSATGVHQLRQ